MPDFSTSAYRNSGTPVHAGEKNSIVNQQLSLLRTLAILIVLLTSGYFFFVSDRLLRILGGDNQLLNPDSGLLLFSAFVAFVSATTAAAFIPYLSARVHDRAWQKEYRVALAELKEQHRVVLQYVELEEELTGRVYNHLEKLNEITRYIPASLQERDDMEAIVQATDSLDREIRHDLKLLSELARVWREFRVQA